MFGSNMLDTAIGVVFIFLLLSVFATAINELVASLLSLRGKLLLKGIQTLVNDPSASGLAKKIYEHGQVFGLYDNAFDPKSKNLPSYIPARNFALALIDSVESNFAAKPIPLTAATAPAAARISFRRPLPQLAPDPALIQAAATHAAEAAQSVVLVSQEFRAAAQALADNPLTEKVGKPLVSMIAVAGGEVSRLQQGIENWYNSGMDRVSGKYKYYSQGFLLAIGFVIAVGCNANAIGIVHQISQDSALRQSIVEAAKSAKDPTPKVPESAADIAGRITNTKNAFAGVTGLGLPLGWPMQTSHDTFASWFSIGIGWILTAVAISLGAPFWFDALNKIMIVRSTVKPSEKSLDEKSKS